MLLPTSSVLVIWLLLNLRQVCGAASVQFVTSVSLPATNLTTGCVTALTGNVSCTSYVSRFKQGSYYQQLGLEQSCTLACGSGLAQWESSVLSACNNQVYSPDGVKSVSILRIPETVRSNYNLTCLEENGEFCNVLAKNASLQTANSTQRIDPCDDCFIRQLQVQVDSPIYGGAELQKEYGSMTSSCQKTSFPLSTSWANTPPATTSSGTPTCAGKTYQIQPRDDCHSISLAQKIATNWLLTDNSLPAYCDNFPQTGSLCLINTCSTYTVQTNDTCSTIAALQNVTLAQLLSWNPVFGISCSNVNRSVGSQICISSPGTPYTGPIVTSAPGTTLAPTVVSPPPTVASGTNTQCSQYYLVQPGDYCNLLTIKFSISLDDFRFLNPAINDNCTNLFADESYCVAPVGDITQYPGHSGYIPPPTAYSTIPWTSFPKATFVPPSNTSISQILPFAPGTRLDCVLYVNGGDQEADPSLGNLCQTIASGWGLSTDQLTNWNPSLNASDPSCHFDPSYRYCVQNVPTPENPTPSTGPTSSYPIRDGSWTNCTTYEQLTFGETCQEVLDGYSITIAQFYAWNPAVGSNCENLWTGYQYCVRTNSSSSTTPTQSSSSAGPTPTAPTQSGQPSNCNRWYTAQSGDTCASVEQAGVISDALFKQFNPAVNSDCSGLWAGYAYCVGTTDQNPAPSPTSTLTSSSPSSSPSAPAVPSPTQANSIAANCNKYAQAASGDYCYAFATTNGISTTNLYAWNSVLGSLGENCNTSFWSGYYYCIGVSS
ncbi:hypothetical protein MMC30_007988 [Trapelia coarctata]|nr:hypothetical protein [Trapelia coarctata]